MDFLVYEIPFKYHERMYCNMVVIVKSGGDFVFAFKIKKHCDKITESELKHCFKINDLEQTGLKDEAYIDTAKAYLVNDLFSVFEWEFRNNKPIGELSVDDKLRFLEFLNN